MHAHTGEHFRPVTSAPLGDRMIAEPGSAAYKRSTCGSPPWRLSDNHHRGFEAGRAGATDRRTSSTRRAAQDAGTAASAHPLGADRDRPVEEAKAAHQGSHRATVLIAA